MRTGTKVAQWASFRLEFGSGHDLMVLEIKSQVRLCNASLKSSLVRIPLLALSKKINRKQQIHTAKKCIFFEELMTPKTWCHLHTPLALSAAGDCVCVHE